MPSSTLIILNPTSGGGRTGRRWARWEPRLRARLGACEVEATRGPRDAVRLAREAARAGVERIVVAGGDGTLSQVVTGLVSGGLGPQVVLGVLPFGTGGDFARALGVPRQPDAALDLLASGKTRPVDVGRLRFRDAAGGAAESCFVNMASVGVSARVVEIANRSARRLGGRIPFLTATLRALLSLRCEPVVVRVDGAVVHDGPLVMAVVANGSSFGSGMPVAPEARVDDGLFDVVVVPELSRLRLVGRLPALSRGRHVDGVTARVHRGREVEFESPGSVGVEADGEPLGLVPASVQLLPGALQFLGGSE